MKINREHVDIIYKINSLMRERWSYWTCLKKMNLTWQWVNKNFSAEEKQILNNMKAFYAFHEKITKTKKLPDFFKEEKTKPH